MEKRVFLFPLLNSVLFKKVTLPYHIFEPRYRQMIKDSIEMDIPIAVTGLRDDNDYRGEVCVAGTPHILSTYPDGRMDIYITGSDKIILTTAESNNPYKIYRYQDVEEDTYLDDSFDLEVWSLKNILERWAKHFLPDEGQRDSFSRTLDDPELLINYCTVFLVDESRIKKEVMLARSLEDKIRILLSVIGPKEVSLGPFMPSLKF